MALTLQPDRVGPIDVAVVAFEGNQFNGEVAPALRQLQADGTVRILDLAFVRKDADGSVTALELTDSGLAEAFADVTGEQFDLLNDADLEQIAEDLPSNSSAAVVVWENAWLSQLSGALHGSNAQVVALERIPRDVVVQAIEALETDTQKV